MPVSHILTQILPNLRLVLFLFLFSLPGMANAETFLATIKFGNLTVQRLCDYTNTGVCTFPAGGTVWQLVNENGHIYIFNQLHRGSVQYLESASLASLRGGRTVISHSTTYTVQMRPMRSVRQ